MSNENGECSEFAVLWARAFPRVRSFVLMCIPRYHDAEDVIQETAVAAAANFVQYDGDKSFVAWVLSIARHRVLRYWRGDGRTRHILFDGPTLMKIEAAIIRTDPAPDSRQDALDACLESLPDRSRNLIQLRYVQGMNVEQVAASHGMTVQSVYSRLYSIRQVLKDCVRRRLNSQEAIA